MKQNDKMPCLLRIEVPSGAKNCIEKSKNMMIKWDDDYE